MANFRQRHGVYKAGVTLLALSVPMAIWGFVAPGWLQSRAPIQHFGESTTYSLLWWGCTSGFRGCTPLDWSGSTVKDQVILGASCLGVFLLIISATAVVNTEFCTRTPDRVSSGPAAYAVAAAASQFTACMLFVSEYVLLSSTGLFSVSLGPSFILTLTSSITSFVAAIMIIASARWHASPGTATGAAAWGQPITMGPYATPPPPGATLYQPAVVPGYYNQGAQGQPYNYYPGGQYPSSGLK